MSQRKLIKRITKILIQEKWLKKYNEYDVLLEDIKQIFFVIEWL